MLDNKSKTLDREIEVTNKPIDIYFSDGGAYPVVLELPSAKEIEDMRSGFTLKISLRDIALSDPFDLKQSQKIELEQELNKYERHSESSTYLVRLANLTKRALGDIEAQRYLEKAASIDTDKYLQHELANNLLSQQKQAEANSIFSKCDLENDELANLRLAHIQVLQRNVDAAEPFILKAKEIDPLDYRAYMFHGAIYLWKGQFELAIRQFKIAEQEHSDSAPLQVNLASAYWSLGNKKKAIFALRKAVALNPLNENAVAFYSDVAFLMKQYEVAIPQLKRYLEWEQKSELMWARLARAKYHTGRQSGSKVALENALFALKHQEAISSNSRVWNNMGLVKWALDDAYSAQKYLNFSFKKSLEEKSNFETPIFNLLGLLIEKKKYNDAYALASNLIGHLDEDGQDRATTERIKLQYTVILEAIGRRNDAIEFIKKTLAEDASNPEVRLDLLIRVIFHHTTQDPNPIEISKYGELATDLIHSGGKISDHLKHRAINNLVFANLIFDRKEKYLELLPLLSSSIHKDPYSTATLGLYHVKKGNLEHGKDLYNEAISMLQDTKTKGRFKQRMNFEMGKKLLEIGEQSKGERLLAKARRERNGFEYINKQIKPILENIKHLH